MADTITESELTSIRVKFEDVNKAGWNTHGAMRAAIEAVGITVIPDPIPEPEGDVIVVDKDGDPWVRKGDNWECADNRGYVIPWANLVNAHGPVKIYRLEKSK